ncbi:MAG: ribosome maturation factor RimM, partial [Wolbachia pipientis]
MNDNLVCLGIITSPHGIKGAVKIKTFTEKPENIFLYGELIIGSENYK